MFLLSDDFILCGSNNISCLLRLLKWICENDCFNNSISLTCKFAIKLGIICFWSLSWSNPKFWI